VAAPDFAGIADRVFCDFMAPLVIGGAMKTHKPIGSKVALAIGAERVAGDPELVSHVNLARIRRARRIVAIDRVEDATAAEWALACALHDVVQANHPGFDGALKRRSATKLLDMVDATLERTPPPRDLRDTLSRHTWFARIFEITRTDTDVAWWVGSSHFKGTDPPARLLAWPELRRVNVTHTPRPLMDMPAGGAAIEAMRLGTAVTAFLAHTPLTDLATCARATPFFAWGAPTLSLIAMTGGRTLAERALAREPKGAVDAALGRATRALATKRAWKAVEIALELLAERALAEAYAASSPSEAARPVKASGTPDAAFARAAGALVARARITSDLSALPPAECARLVAALEPITSSSAARDVEAAMLRAGG
jgi:hypothetical protein